jgi:predicted dehydrogenase
MNKIPVGVIGVGRLGSLHAKMYSQISSADFVGVYDTNHDLATKIAAEYHVKAFASLEEFLANVRAANVVTPTKTHFEIACQALECGVHVFIEKPITATVDEAARLLELAARKNCKIQVGHIERFNPALIALQKYELKPMFIESHRLAQFDPRGTDVAVVLDLMIHDIDVILTLVHSPVRDIQANGVPIVSGNIDIANARIQFENGCVANVTASRISQKKMRKMRLFQKDAYITIDFAGGTAQVFRLIDADSQQAVSGMVVGNITAGGVAKKIVFDTPNVAEVNALKYELELFIDAVRNNMKPVVDGADGLRALEVAHRIIETIRKQQIVL